MVKRREIGLSYKHNLKYDACLSYQKLAKCVALTFLDLFQEYYLSLYIMPALGGMKNSYTYIPAHPT